MAKSMMRRDRPPEFISSPARMKKGMASSVKVSAPEIMFWAMIAVLNMPIYHMSTTPQNIKENATGTPMAMAPRSEPMKTRSVMDLALRKLFDREVLTSKNGDFLFRHLAGQKPV